MTYISSYARSYVRSRATNVMGYECKVERVTQGSHDETTLIYSPGSRTTLYEGVCRVWELSGASVVGLGDTDADLDIASTQISLPWDSPLLKKDDEIVIISAVTDDTMVGKRFQVQSGAKAGELRATRRYAVMAIS